MKSKQLIFLFLSCVFLYSCGGAGILPSDNITLGKAFSHCASTGSYWIGIIIALVITAGASFLLFRSYKKKADWPMGYSIALIACVAVIAFAIFMRPCEVAQNTTVEQAARGVYIGY